MVTRCDTIKRHSIYYNDYYLYQKTALPLPKDLTLVQHSAKESTTQFVAEPNQSCCSNKACMLQEKSRPSRVVRTKLTVETTRCSFDASRYDITDGCAYSAFIFHKKSVRHHVRWHRKSKAKVGSPRLSNQVIVCSASIPNAHYQLATQVVIRSQFQYHRAS